MDLEKLKRLRDRIENTLCDQILISHLQEPETYTVICNRPCSGEVAPILHTAYFQSIGVHMISIDENRFELGRFLDNKMPECIVKKSKDKSFTEFKEAYERWHMIMTSICLHLCNGWIEK